ncbi:MAG: lantibiotic dehydratase family protein [Bacteroidetes bacterium]|nr:lantibiotic dehydratase family protein [Bacteroidota bacterium]MBS1739185.1 lantibiotic dehydratase family protein [Bacteroidota bacterium]
MQQLLTRLAFRAPLLPLTRAYADPNSVTSINNFASGLYLSSQPLYQEYQKINQLSKDDQEKLFRSVTKYQLRASTRCTPYATFAGLSIADVISDETAFVLSPQEQHHVKLRLDMNVVSQIVSKLYALPQVLQQLSFTVNNSLYKVYGGYRYAEYAIHNGQRKYQLNNLADTPYLCAIIQEAQTQKSFQSLSDILHQTINTTQEECDDYLRQLIKAQILVSNLEPPVTDKDPLEHLLLQLENLIGIGEIIESLRYVQSLLQCSVPDIAHLQSINAAIARIGLDISIANETLQADLFLSVRKAQINEHLIQSIVNQVEQLFPLSQVVRQPDLDEFKNRFIQRYEDQLIPLAQAIDSDLGIGYGNVRDELSAGTPLIEGLPIGMVMNNQTIEQTGLNALSLKKYEVWQKEKLPLIEITDEDVKHFAEQKKQKRFATSMSVMGSLFKQDNRLDEQHFVFDMSNVGGPSAGNLLGRFAYGDEQIVNLTRELLTAEETHDPDVIFAEVAHLPQARIGNILLRPLLRQYEIPYIGLSGASDENQIRLEDLWLKVDGNELILWSKRLNKRIIPRLTTAHNYSYQSLPVYKFLCDLQMQGLSFPAVWDWGILQSMQYLPRVIYKNIILRKARWIVTEKDFGNLADVQIDRNDKILDWRKANDIPERVIYAEGDYLQKKNGKNYFYYDNIYKIYFNLCPFDYLCTL